MRLNIKRFSIEASNYTTLTSSAGNKARLEVSWVENNTNVNNNTSNITVTGRIKMTSGAFAQDSVPYLKIYWHNTDKNTNTFLKQTQISDLSSSWVSISETTNQEHASDGTGSGYAYAEWTGSSFAYTPRAGSVSTSNTTLTKIPRVSTLSATTADIGSASTITITRGNSSFTDTITYSFTGNGITRTGTIVTKTNNPTVSFTLPGVNDDKNLYPLIPNDIEINGTLTCITYNGNSEVGRKDYPIKGTVPSTAKPTVRALTLTGSNPEITDTDTKSAAIGVFVQGKSKLSFNLANAFSTDYGSPVDYYELKINGTSVKNDTATTYTMQNALPNTSNTYELKIYDKRGNFGTSGEQPLTAYPYDIPKCSINVERNSSTPTTVTITYSGSITNVANNNRNAKSFKIEYRQAGSSSWVTPAIATITNTYTIASGTTMTKTGISDNNSFEFRITATDSYDTPVTDTINITTSATLINFNANGNTLALGKASEKSDTFEINIKSEFQKEVNITSLSNLKANGTAIATAILQVMMPVGYIYISSSSTSPATLFGFGTWEQIKDKFLLTAGDTYTAGSTGGAATIDLNHTHTSAKHSHGSGSLIASLNFEGNGIRYYYDNSSQPAYNYTERLSATESAGSGTLYGGTRVVGSTSETTPGNTGAALSSSQSILPPYLVVYAWKRIR